MPLLTGRGIRPLSSSTNCRACCARRGSRIRRDAASASHKVVFASRFVHDSLVAGLARGGQIRPLRDFPARQLQANRSRAGQGASLRYELGIPAGAPVVLGVGYADFAKGSICFCKPGGLRISAIRASISCGSATTIPA